MNDKSALGLIVLFTGVVAILTLWNTVKINAILPTAR